MTAQISLAHGLALAGIVSSTVLTAPTACDTQGHDYAFGICSGCDQPNPAEDECEHTDFYPNGYCCDCGEPVPDFEPDDDMITADYLNRNFAA